MPASEPARLVRKEARSVGIFGLTGDFSPGVLESECPAWMGINTITMRLYRYCPTFCPCSCPFLTWSNVNDVFAQSSFSQSPPLTRVQHVRFHRRALSMYRLPSAVCCLFAHAPPQAAIESVVAIFSLSAISALLCPSSHVSNR